MFLNLGNFNSKSGRKTRFGFPFSLNPYYRDPEPIPTGTKEGEFVIATHFIGMLQDYRDIIKFAVNNDDADKGADVYIVEDDRKIGIQIGRLTFNNFPQRKIISRNQGLKFAELIYNQFPVDNHQVLVRIMPKEPHRVPMDKLKHRQKERIQSKLLEVVVNFLKESIPVLEAGKEKFTQLWIQDRGLRDYFLSIDIQFIPPKYYSHLPGYKDIYVDYYFCNSFYNDEDVQKILDRMYKQKNGGSSEILILWSNDYEIFDSKSLVEAIKKRFNETTFTEIFYMTFHETTQMWVIKKRQPQQHNDTV